MKIDIYQPGEEEAIVSLWNRCLYKDRITIEMFERKVLLDPNFAPAGCFVARNQGHLVGFMLSMIRRFPLFYQGLEEDKGWITAFFVQPEHRNRGTGSQLLERALDFLQGQNRKTVWVSPYSPNYFAPGIDLENYPEGIKFLQKHNFEKVTEALSMEGFLQPQFKMPQEIQKLEETLRREQIEVLSLETKYICPFLEFLRQNFPADWYRHSLELLSRGGEKEQILIALWAKKEILGYCQFFNGEGYDWHKPGEHFGPIGVREDCRGKGIGKILLFRCLEKMGQRGIRRVFLLWTDEKTAKFYQQAGLKETRRFVIMKKEL